MANWRWPWRGMEPPETQPRKPWNGPGNSRLSRRELLYNPVRKETMTTSNPIWSTIARLSPVFAVLSGCATAAPPDLVSARAAYAHAEASPAARAAPADLHKARVALDEAEASFRSAPGGEATRDLAYIAERKAMTAEALGSTAIADGQTAAAKAAFETKQGQMLAGAQKDLGRTKEQLAE